MIADLAANGPTEEELARVKRSMVAEMVYAQDSQQSLARIYGVALTTGSTVADVQAWPADIKAVTAEQVKAAARTYLTTARSVTGFLTTAPAQTAAAGADSSAAPQAGAAEDRRPRCLDATIEGAVHCGRTHAMSFVSVFRRGGLAVALVAGASALTAVLPVRAMTIQEVTSPGGHQGMAGGRKGDPARHHELFVPWWLGAGPGWQGRSCQPDDHAVRRRRGRSVVTGVPDQAARPVDPHLVRRWPRCHVRRAADLVGEPGCGGGAFDARRDQAALRRRCRRSHCARS